jgi:hypothetical protein
MARIGLCVLSCAVILSAALRGQAPSGPGAEPDRRQRTLLAVQVALEQGLEHLQRGDFAAAVASLEKQLPYIDGNRRYLAALRDAYRGYVRQLEQAGRQAEANKYRGFLEVLEPAPRGAATATAAVPEAKRAPVHRGKVEVDDPFSESNAAGRRGKGLLDRAERAFEEKQYESAARLYAQADKAEPGCTAGCQERWGYCKLYCVAQALNRPSGEASPAGLEQDVRQGLLMAPRLERFGQGLLDRLRDGGKPGERAVEVRHAPRQGSGWAVSETPNFRIFHMADEATGEKVARIAEATRVTMTRKWFAEEPRDWSPRCDIYIYPTGPAYAKATGAPAASPGHSTISLDAGRVVSRRIDLRGDDANLCVGVLPHETTHVVLAGRFGTHHVPRWADEGMAVLSEPRQRVELHLRNLPTHEREGSLFRVGELMQMADYPEPRRVGPFYAQSVSLVEFLCKRKDPATFARFLREALEGRYESALERHYGYRSFAELERDWRGQASGEGRVAAE